MSSCKCVPLLALALLLAGAAPRPAAAGEFDASVAPDGRWLLKIYPRIFYTSAYFDDDGKAHNLTDVTGLLHAEIPVQVQYGITGALSAGIIVPAGWTYQEAGPEGRATGAVDLREVWLTLQHRWLPLAFISSASVRVKIPLQRKRDFEDGLRIGDDQLDIYPVYYFDYFSRSHFFFSEFAAGYRFRFRSDDGKPFDELNGRLQLGFELIPENRLRLYLLADLTRFQNGDFTADDPLFFRHPGSLHAFGYGMSLWPRPTLRLEITTSGDWSGRNQYRGMHWILGLTKIL